MHHDGLRSAPVCHHPVGEPVRTSSPSVTQRVPSDAVIKCTRDRTVKQTSVSKPARFRSASTANPRGAKSDNGGGNRVAAKNYDLKKRVIGGFGSPLGYRIRDLVLRRSEGQ
ncbi:hypothetical protein, partial [Novipirellula aureliae]|uniref:hypothetical protein n=1 Tax=Novipirellula aureliae TaxID=2527966 RepID=UPI001E5EE154